jgi:hypothetical protein
MHVTYMSVPLASRIRSCLPGVSKEIRHRTQTSQWWETKEYLEASSKAVRVSINTCPSLHRRSFDSPAQFFPSSLPRRHNQSPRSFMHIENTFGPRNRVIL